MAQTGTKAQFIQWLASHKRMTYTRYTELAPDAKNAIQKEYKGRHAPKVAPSA